MISIIVPTLNEISVLEVTLKNLRSLSRFPFEIIISEGRSTDRTVAIAEQYADRVVVYGGTERQTIAHARNLGAEAAHGDFLVFIDADVLIPRPDDFFHRALDAFVQDEKLLAVTVKVRVMPEYETSWDRFWFGFLNMSNTFNNNVLHVGTAPGEFQMMRTQAYKTVGGYNELLVASEDYEMFGKLARIGKTRMLSDLSILHTGRRAHKIGWPLLLSYWFGNWFFMLVFKKAMSKEWKIIR